MVKAKRCVVAVAAAAILIIAGGSTAATAVSPSDELEAIPLTTGVAPLLGVSNEELFELAETQPQAEIDELVASGIPTVTLVGDDGAVLAAAPAEYPAVSPFAINLDLMQGCRTAANACIYQTTGGAWGYKGTGTLNIKVQSVSTVAAGTRPTTFTRDSGTVYRVPAGGQSRMVTAAKIVKIAR